MSATIFVTGTDVAVGKTVVAVAIACAMRSAGLDVGVMKPVECGTMPPGRSDRELLAAAAESCSNDAPEDVCPDRFSEPLAPAVAAVLRGTEIDPARVIAAYRRLRAQHGLLIVEGTGGLCVPIRGNYLMADLAADLAAASPPANGGRGLRLLVVARQSRGTINHTLLTIEAARSRGLEVAGVIFNGCDGAATGMAERTNPDVIAQAASVPILGVLPFLPGLASAAEPVAHIRAGTAGALDLAALRGALG